MNKKITCEDVQLALRRLPTGLCRRFQRIPVPERMAVLEEAGVPVSRMGDGMEEEDIRSLDKAIRYKDSKVQLVRMVLMGRIKNDMEDPETAEAMAAYILERHSLDSVHDVYDERYRGKPMPDAVVSS
ncbi:hypothetical protein OOT00_10845 [Desulfobotulus sp. H1]|uniref:Uncharacterized protein n=1 Tax=Desulfobotulus pelophilus TaxID=2823377 RepID=A0ABT3NAJ4_9BACT|nr:hypothetical protein [Desulfobotulus pelophilus]MCW7754482.1 hypothetical protein [Desulfobotulus pelophilus]